MAKLQPRSSHMHRPPGEVLIKRKKKGCNGDTWEVVRAKGHLDEVHELRKGGSNIMGGSLAWPVLVRFTVGIFPWLLLWGPQAVLKDTSSGQLCLKKQPHVRRSALPIPFANVTA